MTGGRRLARLALTVCTVAVALAAGRAQANQPGEQLSVVGAVVPDAGAPLAVIQDRLTGKTGVYRVGDAVAGGRIVDISPQRVVVDFQGASVELRLAISPQTGIPGGASTARPSPARPAGSDESILPTLRRTELLRLGRAPELLLQVSPIGDEGVRVREVLPGGLLERLGVRQGDIIRDVNGLVPGSSLTFAQAVAQAVTPPSQMLRIHFERQGRMDSTYIKVEH